MSGSAIARSLFALILLGYLCAGALYANYTPPWQAPDEPAHYNTIRQVAEEGCCPRVQAGDWDRETLSLLTSTRFAPEHLDRLASIQYEDHQPPLYYLLASLVYKLSAGDLIALRLLSVGLGAAVVCLAYAVSRAILPGQPQIALAAMALVAFIPQHLSMMAAVNNDALAEVLVALALFWLLRYIKSDSVPVWQLGFIVGLALLTKITIYFLALLAPLAIWLKWRRACKPIQTLLRSLLVFALIAGLMGGLWWLRNIAVYGFPDFLGLAAHDAVVADQPRTAEYIARHGMNTYLGRMLSTTFKSFWGQFGWMALPLDNVLGGWIYRGFGLLLIAGLFGFMLAFRAHAIDPAGRAPVPLLQLRIPAVARALPLPRPDSHRLPACLWNRPLARAPAIALGRAALADAAGHCRPVRAGSLSAVSGDRSRFVALRPDSTWSGRPDGPPLHFPSVISCQQD